MPKPPEIKARRTLNETGVFHIEEIDLEFSNGEQRTYQRVVGSEEGAVLVVPLLDDNTLLLIREYAAGVNQYELAFPKGHIEKGEDVLSAANREMQEETGYAARQLELLSSVSVAPGYIFHTTHIVLASDLYPQRLAGDEPEEIEVVPWKLSAFRQLLEQPDFTEARSQLALFLARDKLQSKTIE
ncbi:MAG: ADP compounds hydrolase NudE [Sedimenticola sp.]|nr:ADP compounds hydrolase NudE [Sedimenticola sp.]MCW8946429.1 ADP compounds hydrolase NudE [Sedimenticola sp.]MCW8948662.1 ADP compounds hydrolase NudE [Sedimenticola sp.]MCW8975592.1 ADP compounds hydrolase NudE [Sedimenticola sp.]